MESTIPVVERFHSLQGEGAHTGRSAFFIRLALCKVGCPWCDTKNSWSTTTHPKETCKQLSNETAKAVSEGAAFVVITGGEPLHHNLDPLCDAIRAKAFVDDKKSIPIHLETSGVNEISGQPNWITLSPKRHALPKVEVLANCHELKVVVHDKDDILFAEHMAQEAINATINSFQSKPYEEEKITRPLLFLQPGWEHQEGYNLDAPIQVEERVKV